MLMIQVEATSARGQASFFCDAHLLGGLSEIIKQMKETAARPNDLPHARDWCAAVFPFTSKIAEDKARPKGFFTKKYSTLQHFQNCCYWNQQGVLWSFYCVTKYCNALMWHQALSAVTFSKLVFLGRILEQEENLGWKVQVRPQPLQSYEKLAIPEKWSRFAKNRLKGKKIHQTRGVANWRRTSWDYWFWIWGNLCIFEHVIWILLMTNFMWDSTLLLSMAVFVSKRRWRFRSQDGKRR